MKHYTVSVVGGDFRNLHLANCLARKGHRVYALLFGEESALDETVTKSDDLQSVLPTSDLVVLPLPVTADGVHLHTPLYTGQVPLADCFGCIMPGTLAVGGMVTGEVRALAETHRIVLADYLQREEMAICNAMLTAEGAIELALRELPTSLFGRNCLVLGYGRVAKALTKLLCGFGAHVTVAARKAGDLAWAAMDGAHPIPITRLPEAASACELVYNTVPAVLLDGAVLARLPKDCLVIDLASKPGGVDFETAKDLSVKVIWALSLPGKTAPLTAGEIIAQTLCNIMEEREAE